MSTTRRWMAVACGVIVSLSVATAQESEPPAPPPEEPAPAPAAPAAEEAPPPKPRTPLGDTPVHRWGGLSIAVDAWGPELSNEQQTIAIVNDGLSTRLLEMPTDAGTRLHWRVWYHLPGDIGSIRFEYDSMRHDGDIRILDPGNYVYGELLVTPVFAGLGDDGLADGLAAVSELKTRDFRLEYERVVFDSARAKGAFHVGFRTIDHAQSLDATYFALLPSFPPLVPPNFPEDFNPVPLLPVPDQARTTSDFSGSGLGAGFDVEFKLHPRFSLTGGFSIAALRGKIDTRYQSSVWAYFLADEAGPQLLTFAEVQAILAAEQAGNTDGDLSALIFQDDFDAVIGIRNESRLAYELDLAMAAEFKVWRSLRVYAGLRELVYVDVASEVRRGAPVLAPSGAINFESFDEDDRTVGYEGFFFGVGYRF